MTRTPDKLEREAQDGARGFSRATGGREAQDGAGRLRARGASASLAIGLRVKSGYAIAVVLGGPASDPKPVTRLIVALSDPEAPETRQPHHDGRGVEMEDRREIARRTKIIERCAKQSVARLLGDAGPPPHRDRGPIRAALVVGSVIDPDTIGNAHIRAHAYEGRLFRTVLQEALAAHGVTCDVIVEKQLATQAARLKQPDGRITRALSAFGKSLGSPWRADEKAAATAAWIALL